MKTQPNKNPEGMTEADLKKLASSMELQAASFTVTLSEPPTSHAELPKFMQPLIDTIFAVNLALRASGSEALGMKAVKFTPSVVAPSSGRGDLEIQVIRARIPRPELHGAN